MVVRRAATAFALGFLAATALVTAASPAQAAADRVDVRASRTFNTGGNPGSVTVTIAKRTKGCVIVSTSIGIVLPGLRADQVQVQAYRGGQWQSIGVSQTGAGVATGRTTPDRPRLCDRQETTARYRVAFAAGAPGGEATLVGEAFTGTGALIGRDAATVRVNGVRSAPSPTGKPSPTPTASPTPSAGAETTVAPFDDALPSDTAGVPAQAASSSDRGLGAGTLVMVGGIGLVVVGAALLVLLLLRARGDRALLGTRGGGAHRASGAPTAFMPPVQSGGSEPPTVSMPRFEDQ
jgi:hypothetical protein